MTTFKAIVTRNSNGSVELTPDKGGNVPGNIEQGSEVDVTIDVTRTSAEIEAASTKKPRGAAAETAPHATTKTAARRT